MRVLELFDASNSTIVCPAGTTISARELADDGRRVGERLRGLGRVAGDRIALQLPNGLPYLRLLLACAAARLVVVSVNTRFTDAEAMDVIERSGASLIVRSVEEFETVVHGGARDGAPLDKGDAEDPFMVFTTSGTTNRPKLVRHTQRSVAEHGRNAARSFGYSDADTALERGSEAASWSVSTG